MVQRLSAKTLDGQDIDVSSKRCRGPRSGGEYDTITNHYEDTSAAPEPGVLAPSPGLSESISPPHILTETIAQMALASPKPLDGVFIAPDIPGEKLKNSMESYSEATPIVLFDTTVFGSAKDGLSLSSDALFLLAPLNAEKKSSTPILTVFSSSQRSQARSE